MSEEESQPEEILNLNDWYTAADAAQVLSANSEKQIKPDYLRSLARSNKVRTNQIGKRATLYRKEDVDKYIVEGRGPKGKRSGN